MRIRSIIENDLAVKYAVLIVLGFLIYSNVLHGEFVSDDYRNIVDNISVHQLNPIEIFKSFNSRFIVGFSFAVNYLLGNTDPFGYHLLNIVIHIINAVLTYHFVLMIFLAPALKDSAFRPYSTQIAFYVSLIFLTHPMQTQAVSYISQRAVSLATMFYLLTLISYAKARLENKPVFYCGAFLFMAAGFFTKEMTFTLPLSLVVYELFFLGVLSAIDRKRLVFIAGGGLLLALVSWLVAHGAVEKDMMATKVPTALSLYWTYFLVEINVLCLYLQQFIFPLNQSHSYDYPMGEGPAGTIATILSALLLVFLIVYALRNMRRERLLSYAVIWFFIATSVEVIFVVLYVGCNNTFMYDHWAYLAMVGFSIFMVCSVYRVFLNDLRIGRYLLCIVIAGFCILSHARNNVWQTEVDLWEDTIRKNPESLVHYLAMGVSYERKGRWQDAVAVYWQGIKAAEQGKLTAAAPGIQDLYLSRVYNNLGIIAADHEHDDARAADFFRRAISVDRYNMSARNNLDILKQAP